MEKTVYEVSFLLQGEGDSNFIKEIIVSKGGEVISFEEPIHIDLAYPMIKVVGAERHKMTSGYFGWVKFELDSEKIADIKKALESTDNVLRFLVIKTVRENTLLHGKMKFKLEEKSRPEEMISEEVEPEAVETKAASEEELDKSIDELVIQ